MRSSHLDRPRIRRHLEASLDSRMTLVTGLAGAGKTTAVRQWLAATEREYCWLGLDARDNDPERFWSRIASVFFDGALESSNVEDLALDLAGHVRRLPPRILVVDDLHFVIESNILEQFGSFVRQISHQHHLVLLSRSRPAIGLARLMADNDVTELGPDVLAFTHDELASLLASPDSVIKKIERATGGWPIAVGLARNLVTTDAAAVLDWSVPQRDIADYLAREVFAALPIPTRDFLRDCSVLDEITSAAADSIFGRSDSAGILDALSARGLIDQAGAGTWSIHAVVRDVLREQVELTSPDRARALHKNASRYFADRDLPLGITHALAADDSHTAAELIEGNLYQLQDVLYTTQLRWFEALPERVISGRPSLCAHAALVAAYERHFPQATRWLRMREASSTGSVDELGALTMELVLLGDMPRLREVAARLRDRVSEDSTLWSLAHGALTGALRSTGDPESAMAVITSMFRGVHDVPEQFLVIQASARAVVVRLLLEEGQLDHARAALQELLAWVVEAELIASYRDPGTAVWAETMVALAQGTVTPACWPDPPLPEAALGLPFLEVWLLLDFAEVRAAVGDDDQAVRALHRVQTRLSRFVDAGDLDEWLRDAGGRYGIAPLPRTGPEPVSLAAPLSERESAVLALLDSDLSLREVAEQLSISQNTLKVHVRAVYRKLGVNSRLSAVRAVRAS